LFFRRQSQRVAHSAAKRVVEQIETFAEMSSDSDSDDFSETETTDEEFNANKVVKVAQPKTSYRFVHRLNGKFSPNKMKSDESYRTHFMRKYVIAAETPEISETPIDDSDIDDNDDVVINNLPVEVLSNKQKQEYNFDEIRQKVDEFDRQQIKGVQFANAGSNNIKIVNNHAVTSKSCTIM